MAYKHDRLFAVLKGKVCEWVLDILKREECYNRQMWADGVVNAIATDGKHADVYINGASAVTASVPIANGLALAVNDQVVILNRARMRDVVILYKKIL